MNKKLLALSVATLSAAALAGCSSGSSSFDGKVTKEQFEAAVERIANNATANYTVDYKSSGYTAQFEHEGGFIRTTVISSSKTYIEYSQYSDGFFLNYEDDLSPLTGSATLAKGYAATKYTLFSDLKGKYDNAVFDKDKALYKVTIQEGVGIKRIFEIEFFDVETINTIKYTRQLPSGIITTDEFFDFDNYGSTYIPGKLSYPTNAARGAMVNNVYTAKIAKINEGEEGGVGETGIFIFPGIEGKTPSTISFNKDIPTAWLSDSNALLVNDGNTYLTKGTDYTYLINTITIKPTCTKVTAGCTIAVNIGPLPAAAATIENLVGVLTFK